VHRGGAFPAWASPRCGCLGRLLQQSESAKRVEVAKLVAPQPCRYPQSPSAGGAQS
jgi:hypothetical protein